MVLALAGLSTTTTIIRTLGLGEGGCPKANLGRSAGKWGRRPGSVNGGRGRRRIWFPALSIERGIFWVRSDASGLARTTALCAVSARGGGFGGRCGPTGDPGHVGLRAKDAGGQARDRQVDVQG